jgi:hypothetical protein
METLFYSLSGDLLFVIPGNAVETNSLKVGDVVDATPPCPIVDAYEITDIKFPDDPFDGDGESWIVYVR